MGYPVKQIAEISRVSKRTLRYYGEINLLKPKYINSSGYHVYGHKVFYAIYMDDILI